MPLSSRKLVFLLSLVAFFAGIPFVLRRVPATAGRLAANVAISLLPLSLAAAAGAIGRVNIERGVLAAGRTDVWPIAAALASIQSVHLFGLALTAVVLGMATVRMVVIRKALSSDASATVFLLPASVLTLGALILHVANVGGLGLTMANLAGYVSIGALLLNVAVVLLVRRRFGTPAPRSALLVAAGALVVIAVLFVLALEARTGHLAVAAGLVR